MDKKSLTIVGVIVAVIIILVCVVMGTEIKNNAPSDTSKGTGETSVSGDTSRSSSSSSSTAANLRSDEVLRINNNVYTKEEFMKYIKYTLYENKGVIEVDEEQYATELENGTSKESIFISNTLNSFYEMKVYDIFAKQRGITVSGDKIEEFEKEFEDNKDKIEQYGLTKEDYVNIKTQKEIPTLISSNPGDYIELPDEVFESYISNFSGDDLKSYTYRMMQVGYTEDSETESGEVVSGDKEEKRAYMDAIVARLNSGDAFETVAEESGDLRLIYSGNGIMLGASAEEATVGFLLSQKAGETLSEKIKQTASGELTEVVDEENAFKIAIVEKSEDGVVGAAKEELVGLLLSEYATTAVGNVIDQNSIQINNSAISRIKINN